MGQELSKDIRPVYAWAYQNSPQSLSFQLRKLGVSHTVGAELIDLGYPQKRWVHITEVPRFDADAINFLCASPAELKLTNLKVFDSLRKALKSPMLILPEYKDLDAMGWVNLISNPSTINNIQTLLYKINPYDLRKKVQRMILGYLKSEVSVANTVSQFRSNLKTQAMIPLLEECLPLRKAVAMAKKRPTAEVSRETGIPEFDILYVLRSK